MKPKDPLWKEYNEIVNSVTKASKELAEKERREKNIDSLGSKSDMSPDNNIKH